MAVGVQSWHPACASVTRALPPRPPLSSTPNGCSAPNPPPSPKVEVGDIGRPGILLPGRAQDPTILLGLQFVYLGTFGATVSLANSSGRDELAHAVSASQGLQGAAVAGCNSDTDFAENQPALNLKKGIFAPPPEMQQEDKQDLRGGGE